MFDEFNDDDFDFDDFMENSQKDFENNLEAFQERMVVLAIENNYANIEENGISDWHLRMMERDELRSLKITLEKMIEHFLQDEEYEKCALLQKHLVNVDSYLVKSRTASQDI